MTRYQICMLKRLLTLVAVALVAFGTVAQPQLKISELLYEPRSGEAEYVELYNGSSVPVDLAGYHIVRVLHDTAATHYPLPEYTVEPHGYVVLTTDAQSVLACYSAPHPSRIVECRLPPYPNGGGTVMLAAADSTVVERFDYAPSMHSPMLRDAHGVSLERRRFDVEVGSAANWFSASSVCGYGTPGYANSQSAEWLVPEADFIFSSELLSPDGDGYQDVLEVEYSMDRSDLMADAVVYDAAGVPVATVLDAALLGTHGTVVWNPEGLPVGRYLFVLTVYDRGGRRQTLRRTVAVVSQR